MRHADELSFYLADLDLELSSVCQSWLETGFANVSSMPHNTRLAIWDIWLATGSLEIFVQASVAILKLSAPFIMDRSYETVASYLSHLPEKSILGRQVLLEAALSIKIPEAYDNHFRS
mmetsp:Transcript_27948/g.36165  ORF Transcript_27948/g.36165 Transcript_27948/m.36165 type:complete len:118 (+) Transcript_27948:2-355(+)